MITMNAVSPCEVELPKPIIMWETIIARKFAAAPIKTNIPAITELALRLGAGHHWVRATKRTGNAVANKPVDVSPTIQIAPRSESLAATSSLRVDHAFDRSSA